MSILNVKNLNLGFRTALGFKQALYNLSYSMEKGQMHALVGESGCGKSIFTLSLLNLLPKNAKITSGKIIFEDKNLLTLPSKQIRKIRGAEIALIPQDPMTSLNPLYTIGNQLLEIIEIHQNIKGKEAEKKAIEALESVQIPDAKNRLNVYPHEFSGGMKQRAIIAMALACQAKIIIADEPTTALDVTIQAQIMSILNNIKKEFGTSILLISHDLALVSQHADEIAVMYSGRIVEKAPIYEFFNYTNHPYSIALLKSLPSSKNNILTPISGQPPAITQDISGCKFHPRCNFKITSLCPCQIPELKEIRPNHFSACFLN